MKMTKLLLICLCCLLVVPTAWAQTANSQAKSGILGYLDPHTGAFRPIPAPIDDSADSFATVTTFGGTITVTFTITLKTTTLTSIICTVDVSTTDAATTAPRFFAETVTGPATGSGTSRSCKLTLPYAWGLTTQASDSMTISYGVAGTGAGAVTQRSSGLTPLATMKVPANGATTALTAAVTL